MKLYFSSVVSKTRIFQFVALYHSVCDNAKSFRYFVLCMDDDVKRILSKANFDSLSLISLSDIEDEEVLSIKNSRKIDEYCWTLKPVVMQYILEQNSDIDRLTYLDADMYFYHNPNRIFRNTEEYAVLLSKHNYSEDLMQLEKDAGKFNSGIVSFRNNPNGRRCLSWWKEQCINWCFGTTITGQFGDQKYLEDMSKLFKNVHSIDMPGVNIAPWNDARNKFYQVNDKLYFGDNPLILYHYCGFRIINKNLCIIMFGNNLIPIIHNPYIKALKIAVDQILSLEPDFDGFIPKESIDEKFKLYNLNIE